VIGARLGYAAPTFGLSVAHDRVKNDLTLLGTHTDTAIGGNFSMHPWRESATRVRVCS